MDGGRRMSLPQVLNPDEIGEQFKKVLIHSDTINNGLSGGSASATLFTMWHQTLKFDASNNELFLFIKYTMPILHAIAISWYVYIPKLWSETSGIGKFMNVLYRILVFSGNSSRTELDIVQIIVVSCLDILIVGGLFACFRYVQTHRAFSPVVTGINCVLMEIMVPFMFLPNIGMLVSTFGLLGQRQAYIIVLFIVYMIISILWSIYVYLSLAGINYGTRPSQTLFASVDGSILTMFIISSGVLMIIGGIGCNVAAWIVCTGAVLHAIFFIYAAYECFSGKMIYDKGVAVGFGLCIAFISSDVLMVFHMTVTPIPEVVRLCVPIGVLAIMTIVGYVIATITKSTVIRILTPDEVDPCDIIAYYESLPIKNIREAVKYIVIGFTSGIPLVLDGTFLLIVGKKFDDFGLWKLIAQLCTFIPGDQKVVAEAILHMKASGLYRVASISRILYMHMIAIQKERTCEVTKAEIGMLLCEMNDATQQAIDLTRKFWTELSIDNDEGSEATLENIASAVEILSKQWKDVLQAHPNEQELVASYGRYCIECLGKFERGLLQLIRCNRMSKEVKEEIDPIFRSFVISQPHLWENGIVDKSGNVMMEMDNTASRSAVSTSSTITGDENIDLGIIDQIGGELIDRPRLRINLEKATQNFTPRAISSFHLLQNFGQLSWVIGIICTLVMYSKGLDMCTISYERIKIIGSLRENMEHVRSMIYIIYASKQGLFFNEQEYEEIIPPEALTEQDEFYYYKNPEKSFDRVLEETLEAFMDLYEKFAESGVNGENVSQIANPFVDSIIDRKFRNENGEVGSLKVSPKSALVSVLWTYHMYSDQSYSGYETVASSDELADAVDMHTYLSGHFDVLSARLADISTEKYEEILHELRTCTIVVVVIGIVICIPLNYISLCVYQREKTRILSVLKKVPREHAMSATDPIMKTNSPPTYYAVSMKMLTGNRKDVFTASMVVGIVSSVIVVMTGVAFVVFESNGNKLMNVISISRFGTARKGLTAEIISYVVMMLLGKAYPIHYFAYEKIYSVFKQTTDDLTSQHNKFVQGYGDYSGIYSLDKDVRKAHVTDVCKANTTSGQNHDFYSCLAIERALSTLIVFANDLVAETSRFDMKSSLFINFMHFSSYEIHMRLKESCAMVDNLVKKYFTNTKIIPIVLLAIGLLLGQINRTIGEYMERKLNRSIKTCMLLIRHLDPVVVASTPEIIDLLSRSITERVEETGDPIELIFSQSHAPFISMSDSYVIETVNQSFNAVFDLADDKIIGKKLVSVIHKPETVEMCETREEQGAFRMYEKLETMKRENTDLPCTYTVLFHSDENNSILVQVSIFPVRNKVNIITNFVIHLEDRRDFSALDNKIEALRKEGKELMNDLVPKEISHFFQGKPSNYIHMVNKVTLVTVRIIDAVDIANVSIEKLDMVCEVIDKVAADYTFFMKVKTIFDTMFYMAGVLDSEEKDYMENGIALSAKIREVVQSHEATKDLSKALAISVVTGGPVGCCLAGRLAGEDLKSMEIMSTLLDTGTVMVSLAPAGSIIFAEPSRELLATMNPDGIMAGPTVANCKTYLC